LTVAGTEEPASGGFLFAQKSPIVRFSQLTVVFSHFSEHEEGFIIDIALNDGLNMQIDKPPSYHGRTASFESPWSYTNSGLRFFAGFLRCSLRDCKRGNWVTLLAILRHSRASATGKAVIAVS